ncbi:hypothetical protein ACFLTD_03560 [Elusimicrobiota bacterium]
MKKKIILIAFLVSALLTKANSARWEDWNLGSELGLGLGSGGKGGRILCPALMLTATRTIENKWLELSLGYMYGSEITTNYSADDIDPETYAEDEQELYEDLASGIDQDVKIRLSVIPMTVNFYYTIFKSFYVGGGVGLYNIFYKREPLGDHRANIDSEIGEIVKSPSTTAMGFQQVVGVQIFPMSDRWEWFVNLKSFITTEGGASGRLFGVTFGGKVKYIW